MVAADLGARQSSTVTLTGKMDAQAFDVTVHPDDAAGAGDLTVEVRYNQFASSDIGELTST